MFDAHTEPRIARPAARPASPLDTPAPCRTILSHEPVARAHGYESLDRHRSQHEVDADDTLILDATATLLDDRPVVPRTPKTAKRIPLSRIYLSGDEVEIADAFKLDYDAVLRHPSEIGTLHPDTMLVLDGNSAMFGDLALTAALAMNAADSGVRVGIHTFNPDHPLLAPLATMAGVTIAHTHRDLRQAMP